MQNGLALTLETILAVENGLGDVARVPTGPCVNGTRRVSNSAPRYLCVDYFPCGMKVRRH